MKMTLKSKKSEANQTQKAANDYGQRLSEQNYSYVCIVKTSTGFGAIEAHPFDVRHDGWYVTNIYECGTLVIA